MASDWVNKYIAEKSAEKGITPSPTPVARTTPTPRSNVAPVQRVQPKTQPKKKLFSGGIVSKGLDLLRIPEYAAASFAQGTRKKADEYRSKTGKGQTAFQKYGFGGITDALVSGVKNIPQGVENRTEFGREEGMYNVARDVTDNPLIQTGANLGMSLAAPALPISKIASVGGKVASKVPGATTVGKFAQKGTGAALDYARKSPSISKTVEKLPGLEYFRNPEAGKIIQGATDVAERRISSLYNKITDVAKGLSKAERVNIGQIIQGGISSNPRLIQRANYIRQISDDIGREVVDQGLMSPESFAKFKGKYLSHIADVVKKDEMSNLPRKMLSFTSNSLKQRKDKLGTEGYPDYIREFQFPTFKSLAGEIQNVESVKAIKKVANKFGVGAEKFDRKFVGPRTSENGLIALEDVLPGKVGTQFKGVAVPEEIADYVSRKYSKVDPGFMGRIADKALDMWKLGKTVYSGPAYHVRNLMSNQILSDMSTGAGLPKTIAAYGRAVKAYMGKGDPKMTQYLAEAKDAGMIGRQSISQGIESLRPEVFGQGQSTLKKILNSPKKFQQASEETSKLQVFAHFREQGKSIEEAMKLAEEAIFSPYNLSKTERGLVRGAVPFYSFTRQALPFTAKTAVKSGNRITKYEKAKTAVEGLSPEGTGDEPPQEGMVRLPMKNKEGKYVYFDPKFTLPFGNFDTGTDGNPIEKGQLPFGLGLNPIISEGASQLFNKDLYFDQPIAKSNVPERARVQRIQHGVQTFAPNILPTDFVGGIPTGEPGLNIKARGGSKLYDAFTNQPDYAGRTRSRVQAILDTFGLKTSSVNPDQPKFDASARAKALKAIQTERRTIMGDKRLSPEDKKQIIQQLNEASQALFSK